MTYEIQRTGNRDDVLNGGGLLGYVDATYDELVAAFGEPERTDPSEDEYSKVQAEWARKVPVEVLCRKCRDDG